MYKWGYSWPEIKNLYIARKKDEAERLNSLCTFLVDLTQAALGGGKSDNPDEIGLADDTGKDEMSDEQIEMWRGILTPEEFQAQYGDYL